MDKKLIHFSQSTHGLFFNLVFNFIACLMRLHFLISKVYDARMFATRQGVGVQHSGDNNRLGRPERVF